MLSAYRSCRLFPTSILHRTVTEMDTTLFKHTATRSRSLPLTFTLLPAGGNAVMNVVKTTQNSHLPHTANTATPMDIDNNMEEGFRVRSQKVFPHISSRHVFQLQICASELESFLPLAPPGCSFKHQSLAELEVFSSWISKLRPGNPVQRCPTVGNITYTFKAGFHITAHKPACLPTIQKQPNTTENISKYFSGGKGAKSRMLSCEERGTVQSAPIQSQVTSRVHTKLH